MSSLLKSRWGSAVSTLEYGEAPPPKSSRVKRLESTKKTSSALVADSRTKWSLNTKDIKNDMTAGDGRPQWILTTYGPGRGPPASLLEGSEYSFEELRVRYYELAGANNQAQADQEAAELWTKAERGMREVANNAEDVIKFMEDAEKKHPNRYDFCQTDGTKTREELAKAAETKTTFGTGLPTGFGTVQTSATAAFGRSGSGAISAPSGQTAVSSGFGQPGFGQPAQPVASANPFAKPSAATGFGQPAFGQASGFGQPAQVASGFGQPSQPTSGFGLPAQTVSTFGQPAASSGFGQSGFGQPAKPAASANPFAAPSAAMGLGQTSQPKSLFGESAFQPFSQPTTGFGQPSQPSSGFGAPSQPTTSFGQVSQLNSGFGQPSQASGFGQAGTPTQAAQPATSTLGQPSQSASGAFGQPSQPALTGFGQQSEVGGFGVTPATSTGGTTTTANPFAQPSTTQNANPFATKSSSSSPFGQPPQQSGTGGFGQPSNAAPSSQTQASSGFGSTISPATFGGPANNVSAQELHPLTNAIPAPLLYTETLPKRAAQINPQTRKVTSYAGRRVQYINDAPCYERPDGKGWERIWFPEMGAGADVKALNQPEKAQDLQACEKDYTEDVKNAFIHLFSEGSFGAGGLPRAPPLREWCAFDF